MIKLKFLAISLLLIQMTSYGQLKLENSVTHFGNISNRNSTIQFEFKLTEEEEVTIILGASSEETNLDLFLYDEDLLELDSVTDNSSSATITQTLEKGTYFIEIVGSATTTAVAEYSLSFSSAGKYPNLRKNREQFIDFDLYTPPETFKNELEKAERLHIAPISTPGINIDLYDENKKRVNTDYVNNSDIHSTGPMEIIDLHSKREISDRVSSFDDAKYYKFKLDNKANVTVNMEIKKEDWIYTEARLELYDSNFKSLDAHLTTLKSLEVSANLSAGYYFIGVKSIWGILPFDLKIAEGDFYDEEDVAPTALTENVTENFNLATAGQRNQHKITITETGKYYFHITPQFANENLRFNLYDENQANIFYQNTKDTGGRGAELSPGTYTLYVYSNNSTHNQINYTALYEREHLLEKDKPVTKTMESIDSDYYFINLDYESEVWLDLSFVQDDANFNLTFRGDGSVLTINAIPNMPLGQTLPPGKYYVEVEATSIFADSVYYTLSYSTSRIRSYPKLEEGINFQATKYNSYVDYYQFELTEKSTVTVDLSFINAESDLSVILINDYNEAYLPSDFDFTDQVITLTEELDKGKYIIGVIGYDLAASDYTIKYTADPIALDYKILEKSSPENGVLYNDTVRDDSAYYQLTLEQEELVELRLTYSQTEGNAGLYIYDTESNLLISADTANDNEFISTTLQKGTYTIVIDYNMSSMPLPTLNYTLTWGSTHKLFIHGSNSFSVAHLNSSLDFTSQTSLSDNLDTDVWKIAGVADINGDGYDDILWHSTTGVVGYWLLNEAGNYISGGLTTTANVNYHEWHVVSFLDINNDATADIIWQSEDGIIGYWLLNTDGSLKLWGLFSNDLAVYQDWKVSGFGDINQDGVKDIIWRSTSGVVGFWMLNADLTVKQGGLTVDEMIDFEENKLIGSVDLDGDNTTDYVWQNSTGYLTYWLLNADGSLKTQGSLTNDLYPKQAWKINISESLIQGKTHILFQHSNGMTQIAELSNMQLTNLNTLANLNLNPTSHSIHVEQ